MTGAAPTEEDVTNMRQMRVIAKRECAPALAIVRENYSPSKAIEDIMLAAFIHGAGWACANLMPKEH